MNQEQMESSTGAEAAKLQVKEKRGQEIDIVKAFFQRLEK